LFPFFPFNMTSTEQWKPLQRLLLLQSKFQSTNSSSSTSSTAGDSVAASTTTQSGSSQQQLQLIEQAVHCFRTAFQVSDTEHKNFNVADDRIWELCHAMVHSYRAVLPAVFVQASQSIAQWTVEQDTSFCIVSARLISILPHLLGSFIQCMLCSHWTVADRLQVPSKMLILKEWSMRTLLRSLTLCLRSARTEFANSWDFSPVYSCLEDSSDMVRYCAAELLSVLHGLTTHDMDDLLQRHVVAGMSDDDSSERLLAMQQQLQQEETLRLVSIRASMWNAVQLDGQTDTIQLPLQSMSGDVGGDDYLSSQLVSIGGVVLPRKSMPHGNHVDSRADNTLVPVSNTDAALRAIAMATCEGIPVLLEGPVGCGKSCLLDECARLTGNVDIIRIHLDDQIDSKTLIGTYTCTDVPGEFMYQPGAITQAVQQGRWVVLEDIDHAPFEVISSLIPLFEKRRLFLPGRGETIIAAHGFHLFATRTTTQSVVTSDEDHKHNSMAVRALRGEIGNVLSNLFSRVSIAPLSRADLAAIVSDKYSLCTAFTQEIIETYVLAAVTARGSLGVDIRQLTTRDLFRLCKRLNDDLARHNSVSATTTQELPMQARESVFASACDCFSSAFATEPVDMIAEFARIWHIPAGRVEFFRSLYKPRWVLTDEELCCGQCTLPRAHGSSAFRRAAASGAAVSRYAYTKHSLRLMERLLFAVRSAEPVLLVGETGNGKTAVIQHLAAVLGKKLVVQNLNQQTDSSDFLGGYKPVELRTVCIPLMNRFGTLFPKTFSRSANQTFLARIKASFDQKQWDRVASLLRQATNRAFKKLNVRSSASASASIAVVSAASQSKHTQDNTNKRNVKRKSPTSAADIQKRRKVPVSDSKQTRPATTTASTSTTAASDSPAANSVSKNITAASRKAQRSAAMLREWKQFEAQLSHFDKQLAHVQNSFAFWFAEGSLVKALREGHWLLLDEVNLASQETLERLGSVLENGDGSITLFEKGELSEVKRHPNFRLFANMNPPTDFGKRALPPAIRARFTEIYVHDIEDVEDLSTIVRSYLSEVYTLGSRIDKSTAGKHSLPLANIVHLYLQARMMARSALLDGSNQKPHYSVRTLCRALSYCRRNMSVYGFARSLYEGFEMSFLSPLRDESRAILQASVRKFMMLDADSKTSRKSWQRAPRCPGEGYVKVGAFWLKAGDQKEIEEPQYIITPTIQRRLHGLARTITAQYPILLQGPTSSGKTSLVEYVAKLTGHKFVRINNHEHTDIQEYMGTYVSGTDGKLVFQEGLLVQAVRYGYWIVLDELNLAPSEVLEALNRLLDDNRELFIPETQEVVRPHPHFMLFATQNPPGIYGGRKVLSRAFRNRFVELHIDEIPDDELIIIIERRCKIPPSYSTRMVQVMKELQKRRQKSHIFQGKHGFITPRDLFRWGERRPQGYQQLAEFGFMLLGERLRTEDEKSIVRDVVSTHCKWKINDDEMYARETETSMAERFAGTVEQQKNEGLGNIAWTFSMRRLFTLVDACLRNNESVLLVGETGCGKTTICQLFSMLLQRPLRVINCHQHTETADFLGNLRPIRGKDAIAATLRNELVQCANALHDWVHTIEVLEMSCASTTTSSPPSLTAASAAGDDATMHDKASADDAEAEVTTQVQDILLPATGQHIARGDIDIDIENCSIDVLLGWFHSTLKLISKHPQLKLDQPSDANMNNDTESTDDAAAPSDSTTPARRGKKRKSRRQRKLEQAERKRSKQRKVDENNVDDDDDDDDDDDAKDGNNRGGAPIAVEAENAVSSSSAIAAIEAIPDDKITNMHAASAAVCAVVERVKVTLRKHNALFEWHDGALVQAMKEGELVLIDEISLAEDSVLERLNSVLERTRTLTLAEKGGADIECIRGHPNFQVFATMNPGGDFGKKELSPALRNRFTEIWVPSISNEADLIQIMSEYCDTPAVQSLVSRILHFVQWFNTSQRGRRLLSLRDVLSWMRFLNTMQAVHTDTTHPASTSIASDSMDALEFNLLHGACLTLLDGLSIGTTQSEVGVRQLRKQCLQQLMESREDAKAKSDGSAKESALIDFKQSLAQTPTEHFEMGCQNEVSSGSKWFGVHPFYVPRGTFHDRNSDSVSKNYSLKAPTTGSNLTRLLRAMQLPKAILLEGSPGVGKTSLVTTLAAATGHKVVRINLSEQTDMMDLLGLDLPVHGGKGGQFAWCDGVFLQALKAGSWVLLDELNLASQSVLEGLNAVLDHRATVYIPELDRTFHCPPSFRIFACQNPVSEGGGRKGLPKSFLNRFTKVYLEPLQHSDMTYIVHSVFSSISFKVVEQMVCFNRLMHEHTMVEHSFGRKGAPWEFNLRDVFRWCDVAGSSASLAALSSSADSKGVASMVTHSAGSLVENQGIIEVLRRHVEFLYVRRLRAAKDRTYVRALFEAVFVHCQTNATPEQLDETKLVLQWNAPRHFTVSPTSVQIGNTMLERVSAGAEDSKRSRLAGSSEDSNGDTLLPLHHLRPALESIVKCINMNWPVLVIGPQASGKTSLIRLAAQLAHRKLFEFAMSSSADATELLGCFEQVDLARHKRTLLDDVHASIQQMIVEHMHSRSSDQTAVQRVVALNAAWRRLHAGNSAAQEATDVLTDTSTTCFSMDEFQILSDLLDELHHAMPNNSQHKAQVERLRETASRIQQLGSARDGVIGNFEWIDGALIHAMEQGHWVLLDNVNFCNPSVLDRLNPLLEPNGVLLVNECGLVDGKPRIVKPHADFRLFLAMNPSHGEISRAMRNRCVEVALLKPIGTVLLDALNSCGITSILPLHDDENNVDVRGANANADADADTVMGTENKHSCSNSSTNANDETHANNDALVEVLPGARMSQIADVLDSIAMLNSMGVNGASLPSLLLVLHARICDRVPAVMRQNANPAVSTRQLLHFAGLVREQVDRAVTSTFQDIVIASMNQVYTEYALSQSEFHRIFEEWQTATDATSQRNVSDNWVVPSVWPYNSHHIPSMGWSLSAGVTSNGAALEVQRIFSGLFAALSACVSMDASEASGSLEFSMFATTTTALSSGDTSAQLRDHVSLRGNWMSKRVTELRSIVLQAVASLTPGNMAAAKHMLGNWRHQLTESGNVQLAAWVDVVFAVVLHCAEKASPVHRFVSGLIDAMSHSDAQTAYDVFANGPMLDAALLAQNSDTVQSTVLRIYAANESEALVRSMQLRIATECADSQPTSTAIQHQSIIQLSRAISAREVAESRASHPFVLHAFTWFASTNRLCCSLMQNVASLVLKELSSTELALEVQQLVNEFWHLRICAYDSLDSIVAYHFAQFANAVSTGADAQDFGAIANTQGTGTGGTSEIPFAVLLQRALMHWHSASTHLHLLATSVHNAIESIKQARSSVREEEEEEEEQEEAEDILLFSDIETPLQHLIELTHSMSESLQAFELHAADTLWQHDGHPLLSRSSAVHSASTDLCHLQSHLRVPAAMLYGIHGVPASLQAKIMRSASQMSHAQCFTDQQWKLWLLEALCLVEYAKEQQTSESEVQLQHVLQTLSTHFETRRLKYTSDMKHSRWDVRILTEDEIRDEELALTESYLASRNESGKQLSQTPGARLLQIDMLVDYRQNNLVLYQPLWALYDQLSLRLLWQALAELQHATTQLRLANTADHNDVRKSLSDIANSVEHVIGFILARSSIAPEVIVPLQQFCWFISGSASQPSLSMSAFTEELESVHMDRLSRCVQKLTLGLSRKMIAAGRPRMLFDDLKTSATGISSQVSSVKTPAGGVDVVGSALPSLLLFHVVGGSASVALNDRMLHRARMALLSRTLCGHSPATALASTSNSYVTPRDISSKRMCALAVDTLLCFVGTVPQVSDASSITLLIGQLHRSETIAASDLDEACSALAQSTDSRFGALVHSHLLPCLQSICNGQSTTDVQQEEAGVYFDVDMATASVHLALLRVHCICPSTPIDPVVRSRIRKEDLENQQSDLAAAKLASEWHDILAPRAASVFVDVSAKRKNALAQIAVTVQESLDDMKTDITQRVEDDDCASFPQLFHECQQFLSSYVSSTRWTQSLGDISLLLAADSPVNVNANNLSKLAQAGRELQLWVENASQFTRRLQINYAGFPDIVQPVCTAVSDMQVSILWLLKGIRCRMYNASSQSPFLSKAFRSLLEFGAAVSGDAEDNSHAGVEFLLNRATIDKLDGYCHDAYELLQRRISTLRERQREAVDTKLEIESRSAAAQGGNDSDDDDDQSNMPGFFMGDVAGRGNHGAAAYAALDAEDLNGQGDSKQRSRGQNRTQRGNESDVDDEILERKTKIFELINMANRMRNLKLSVYMLALHKLETTIRRCQNSCSASAPSSAILSRAMVRVHDLFGGFLRIWYDTQQHKKLREEEEQALYKFKHKEQTHSTKSDEQVEDEEVKQLYPDFAGQFADIAGDLLASQQSADPTEAQPEALLIAEAAGIGETAVNEADKDFLELEQSQLVRLFDTFEELYANVGAGPASGANNQKSGGLDHEADGHEMIKAHSEAYDIACTLGYVIQLLSDASADATSSESANSDDSAEIKLHVTLDALPSALDRSLYLSHVCAAVNGFHQLDEADIDDASHMRKRGATVMRGGITEWMQNATASADPLSSNGRALSSSASSRHRAMVRKRSRQSRARRKALSMFRDVYRESYISEAKLLVAPLQRFVERLRALLAEFPRHPILLQLIRLADRLGNIACNAPLMQYLTGLEFLIKKSESWQEFASKRVSISAVLEPMYQIAARWRRLELHAWPYALHEREARFRAQAVDWWVRLYELVHVTPDQLLTFVVKPKGGVKDSGWSLASTFYNQTKKLDSTPSSSDKIAATFSRDDAKNMLVDNNRAVEQDTTPQGYINRYLTELHQALDEFIQHCALGEMPHRLQMLHGFVRQVRSLVHVDFVQRSAGDAVFSAKTKLFSADDMAAARRRAANIMENLWTYYSQFLPMAETFLAKQREPIEKKLKDQVKLHKWDVSNFWSLRESSDKSHRRLNRFSKEWADTLDIPFRQLLGVVEKSDAKEGDTTVKIPLAQREQEAMEQHHATADKARKRLAKKQKRLLARARAAQQDDSTTVTTEPSAAAAAAAAAGGHDESLDLVEVYLNDFVMRKHVHIVDSEDCGVSVVSAQNDTSAILTTASYLRKVPSLVTRSRKLLSRTFFNPDFLDARDAGVGHVEYACTSILHRVTELQELNKVSLKKKGFISLMKNLKKMGLSYHSAAAATIRIGLPEDSSVQLDGSNLHSLFQLAPLSERSVVSALQQFSVLYASRDVPLDAWIGQCRDLVLGVRKYTPRLIAGMRKLRARRSTCHRDLSATEVARSLCLAEHLFAVVTHQRSELAQSSSELQVCAQWLRVTEQFAQLDNVTRDASSGNTAGATTVLSWLHTQQLLLLDVNSTLATFIALFQDVSDMLGSSDSKFGGLDRGEQLPEDMVSWLSSLTRQFEAACKRIGEQENQLAVVVSSAHGSTVSNAFDPAAAAAMCDLQSAGTSVVRSTFVNLDMELSTLIDIVQSVRSFSSGLHDSVASSLQSLQQRWQQVHQQFKAATAVKMDASASSAAAAAAAVQDVASCVSALDSATEQILLAVQDVHNLASRDNDIDNDDVDELNEQDTNAGGALVSEWKTCTKLLRRLRLPKFNKAVCTALTLMSTSGPNNTISEALSLLHAAIRQLYPLLVQYAEVCSQTVVIALRHHKSCCKLLYIVLNLYNAIYARGFCRPPDMGSDDDDAESGDDGGDGTNEQTASGTGFGDGEGEQDVSNQVQDEEQLLGTKEDQMAESLDDTQQKQQDQPEDNKADDPDTGVEMGQDFDGDMFDVDENQDDEEDEDPNEDDDAEELDREMGDLGDDDQSNAVDQKLWDDDEDDDDDGGNGDEKEEKYEKDAPINDQQDDEAELMAKENNDEPQSKNDDDNASDQKQKQQQQQSEDQDMNAEPEAEQDEDGHDGDDDDGLGEDQDGDTEPQGPINDQDDMMEENTGIDATDFPEDMQLDDDAENDDDGGDEDKANEDEDGNEGDDSEQQQEADDDGMTAEEALDAPLPEDQPAEADGNANDADADDADDAAPDDDDTDANAGGGSTVEDMKVDPDADDDDGEDEQEDGEDEKEDEKEDEDDPLRDSTDESNRAQTTVESGPANDVFTQPDAVQGQEAETEQSAPNHDDDKQEDDTSMDDAIPETAAAAPQQQQQQDASDSASASAMQMFADPNATQGQRRHMQSSAEQNDQQQQQQQQQQQSWEKTNPYRSLGDAMKQWNDRLNMVQQEQKDLSKVSPEDDPNADATDAREENEDDGEPETAGNQDADMQDAGHGQYEHVGDSETADAQVMLPTTDVPEDEDAVPQNDQQNEPDDGDENEKPGSGDTAAQQADDPEQDQQDNQESEDQRSMSALQAAEAQRRRIAKDDEFKLSEENNDMEVDDETKADDADAEDAGGDDSEHVNSDDEDEDDSKLLTAMPDTVERSTELLGQRFDLSIVESMRGDLMRDFDQWQRGDSNVVAASHQQWSELDMRTSDLAQQLCEQLRTILEPTLATRLKGDYRTGKRINIKKIIPYIASQFRKDKIWLRRTKPQQRQYQVMIAIDDSESMLENGAGDVAMQALSVLCRSLTQLEVGQIGVVSFGDSMRMLHSFDQPLSDDHGAYVLSQFEFQQRSTSWPRFLEGVVSSLEYAKLMQRTASSGEEQLQLVFVISDARVQQDRELVARWSREALSKGQLLVMLIIDSPERSKSILSLKSVSYPDGKLKLVEYLDGFPFPFYVILQDIESLPLIVADALRQWFQLIQRAGGGN
jgi:midasin (ATPase involved in ribosome maturation)